MNRFGIKVASATLAISAGLAGFAAAGSADVVVSDAWSRASIGTSRPGVAYMTIENTGTAAVTLTGLRTEIAMMPEVHRTATNSQGVASMTPAGDIEIGPGELVALEPGGLHAMLMGLAEPLVEGQTFRMALEFSDGGEVEVEVPILGIAARGPTN